MTTFDELKKHCIEHRKINNSCLGCCHQRLCDEIKNLIDTVPAYLEKSRKVDK